MISLGMPSKRVEKYLIDKDLTILKLRATAIQSSHDHHKETNTNIRCRLFKDSNHSNVTVQIDDNEISSFTDDVITIDSDNLLSAPDVIDEDKVYEKYYLMKISNGISAIALDTADPETGESEIYENGFRTFNDIVQVGSNLNILTSYVSNYDKAAANIYEWYNITDLNLSSYNKFIDENGLLPNNFAFGYSDHYFILPSNIYINGIKSISFENSKIRKIDAFTFQTWWGNEITYRYLSSINFGSDLSCINSVGFYCENMDEDNSINNGFGTAPNLHTVDFSKLKQEIIIDKWNGYDFRFLNPRGGNPVLSAWFSTENYALFNNSAIMTALKTSTSQLKILIKDDGTMDQKMQEITQYCEEKGLQIHTTTQLPLNWVRYCDENYRKDPSFEFENKQNPCCWTAKGTTTEYWLPLYEACYRDKGIIY